MVPLAELLAPGTILLEPLQPEHFPQQAILLLEPVAFLLELAAAVQLRAVPPLHRAGERIDLQGLGQLGGVEHQAQGALAQAIGQGARVFSDGRG